MNTRNVQNGPGLVIVQQIQISCFSIAVNLVEHVVLNHVSLKVPMSELLYNLKSLTSEAIPSATQFFKRAYKISHFPGL